MKDKAIGIIMGIASPHVQKLLIEHAWWSDWAKPALQSFIGAVIGLLVIHFGKRLLNSFDNWRTIRKLGKFRDNGRHDN